MYRLYVIFIVCTLVKEELRLMQEIHHHSAICLYPLNMNPLHHMQFVAALHCNLWSCTCADQFSNA